MGLISAALNSASGVLADQWKEYFYCESIPVDTLVVKGVKRTSARSTNTKGSDNIISNGSVIAVADGQCMIIVDQGKIVEICAEPGEFVYDTSTEPSIFSGNLGTSIKESFAAWGRRFTFGGEPAKDQRVYYFNTKELIGNKYGTPSPVPFRVVDPVINFSATINIRCFGEFSYHICDPILFYKNVCNNVAESYTRDKLDSTLKTELLTALQPALSKISALHIDYSELPGHTFEIADALNEILSTKWRDLRGIEIVSFGVSSVKASEEDEARLKQMQETAYLGSSANLRAGHMASGTVSAMNAAANNTNGAIAGFAGMNMANAAGMNNAAMFTQQPETGSAYAQQVQAQSAPAQSAAAAWICSQGHSATGKFCPECGEKKPEQETWTCSCGSVNTGKFCPQCGKAKPAAVKCTKCGWEPEDKTAAAPKFCPECGTPFGG